MMNHPPACLGSDSAMESSCWGLDLHIVAHEKDSSAGILFKLDHTLLLRLPESTTFATFFL